jgi:hypothetical protein
VVLTLYLLWQGLAFVAFTMVTDYYSFLLVSLAWGWSSTLPSLSTQAAMTWVWGKKAGPWLQLNNAGFGIGATPPCTHTHTHAHTHAHTHTRTRAHTHTHTHTHNLISHLHLTKCELLPPCATTALAGALTAPLLLSWDIDKHDTFHNAYLMIAAANFTVAFTPLLASSPQQDPGAGPGVTPIAAAPLMVTGVTLLLDC